MSNRANSLNQMPNCWTNSTPVHHHQSLSFDHLQNTPHLTPMPAHNHNDHRTGTNFVTADDKLSYDNHSYASPTNSTELDHSMLEAARHGQQLLPPHLNTTPNQNLQSYAPNTTQAHARTGVAASISSPTSATPTTRSTSRRYMTRNSQVTNNAQPMIPHSTPTVNFRPLPFFDQVCEIIAPTLLQSKGIVGVANESKIEFKLAVDMADLVAMNRESVNIILRFCQIDAVSSLQDDNFPPDITINVNGRPIGLAPAISNPNRPGVPAKRPGQHVEITHECKLCPFTFNHVYVKWFVDPTDLSKQFACTMMIGEKQSIDTLLSRIRLKGLADSEATKKIIADTDNEVATTNLQCSLLCPLGKMRMIFPCKSNKCQHIPCFDASTYLQMNEKKPTWICPVCYKSAYFPDLIIDGYFTDILEKTYNSITEVTINLDGTWSPLLKLEQPISADNPGPEVITISDDDD